MNQNITGLQNLILTDQVIQSVICVKIRRISFSYELNEPPVTGSIRRLKYGS